MLDLVSILIPTRERPDTLKHSLRTAVGQTYPNIEIIVSDNASGPATREVVEAFADPRIRYVNTGRRVSMTANFEFALSHATGDWISVIGDDDGILPSGIERGLAALKKTGLEALGSDFGFYVWPYRPSGRQASLSVPLRRGYCVEDAKASLYRLLHLRRRSYHFPRLYTGGIVSRAIIKRVMEQTGDFFLSRNPDIYSVFAVNSQIKRFVFMREPIMIGGTSRHSTGSNILGQPGKTWESEENIANHPGMRLHHNESLAAIPPTNIYESHLQAKRLSNYDIEADVGEQIALALHYSYYASPNNEYKQFLYEWSNRFLKGPDLINRWSFMKARSKFAFQEKVQTFERRFIRFPEYFMASQTELSDCNDVYSAAVLAEKIISKRPSLISNALVRLNRAMTS